MASRLIRLSSRALGEQRRVVVRIYESPDEMRTAAERFNHSGDNDDVLGVTQCYCTLEGVITVPIVRLSRGHLGSQIVGHELHHAATAIYGSTIADETARDVLTHHNEPFAHLYSDLLRKLVDALWRHGYYGEANV